METTRFEQKLNQYADLLLRIGLNFQPGQELAINATGSAETMTPFIRRVAESAYRAGARYVDVVWMDEQLQRIQLAEAVEESLAYVPAWRLQRGLALLEKDGAYLALYSPNPDLLAGQDTGRITALSRARAFANRPFAEAVQRGEISWLVGSVPGAAWAGRVFPDLPEAERIPALWEALFGVLRLDRPDPVAAWQAHLDQLQARCAWLSQRQLAALQFTGPGTDLTVGLPPAHRWLGGRADTRSGRPFTPNLPTEEVFTMPHREQVDGVVRSSRPLSLNGVLIEDFTLTFRGGCVVDVSAARGEAMLRQLIETDEGAGRLGEVALVPDSSPISRSGLLFYDTLFDENAACHLALGAAYRLCLPDGAQMSDDVFRAAGGNVSAVHHDFMIGSDRLDVTGIEADGARTPLLRQGEWAFDLPVSPEN